MTNQQQPPETLLQFPCDFTIKVFGAASDEFDEAVLAIIKKHATLAQQEEAIQSRASESNKYRALSITVHVTSKAQLDQIYQELTKSPLVIMAL